MLELPQPALRQASPVRFPSPLAAIPTLGPRTAAMTTPVREINIRLAPRARAASPTLTNDPLPREPEKTLPPHFWDVDLEQQQEHEHCEHAGEEQGWPRRQERVGLRATLARVLDVMMNADATEPADLWKGKHFLNLPQLATLHLLKMRLWRTLQLAQRCRHVIRKEEAELAFTYTYSARCESLGAIDMLRQVLGLTADVIDKAMKAEMEKAWRGARWFVTLGMIGRWRSGVQRGKLRPIPNVSMRAIESLSPTYPSWTMATQLIGLSAVHFRQFTITK
ncbi:hypothetical protein B0H67DRAFT_642562 [Lasiosphaeris hirsuta]|uniref:Uncharacterized protein n=1 Tax=Lasiosphaeris hirsuta TaxID=260670 RepID=A0AA40ANN7_9PEZI|nr:hypothetical protein B0H67DRAFT_642562 [Lasiosphaeris hirsuta]